MSAAPVTPAPSGQARDVRLTAFAPTSRRILNSRATCSISEPRLQVSRGGTRFGCCPEAAVHKANESYGQQFDLIAVSVHGSVATSVGECTDETAAGGESGGTHHPGGNSVVSQHIVILGGGTGGTVMASGCAASTIATRPRSSGRPRRLPRVPTGPAVRPVRAQKVGVCPGVCLGGVDEHCSSCGAIGQTGRLG